MRTDEAASEEKGLSAFLEFSQIGDGVFSHKSDAQAVNKTENCLSDEDEEEHDHELIEDSDSPSRITTACEDDIDQISDHERQDKAEPRAGKKGDHRHNEPETVGQNITENAAVGRPAFSVEA